MEGLILFEPKIFKDTRGAFYESWRQNTYGENGVDDPFVQDNVSLNAGKVLRGLHFQKEMGQMVTVVHGKIWDVVVDMRPTSPTVGKHFSTELSEENAHQLYMPPGFAHGFCVLSDAAVVQYKCTQYYDPSKEGGLLWNDPDLGIQWPLENPIVSERDEQHPRFKDIKVS